MKKLYILLMGFFAMVSVLAQTNAASHHITLTDMGQGVVKIVYDGSADSYSFYSPGSGNPIYVYNWVNAGDSTVSGVSYSDKWSTTPPVVLNYDSATNTFIGEMNFATHNFDNSGGVMPAGAVIYTYNFIFRNADGTSQSANTWQTFNPGVVVPVSTLAVSDHNTQTKKSLVSNGKLYTSKKGKLTFTVYDFGGKLIKTSTTVADGNPIDLNISQTGIYLLKISNEGQNEIVKFVK